MAALKSGDDIGVIIRCHYEIESAARHTLGVLSSNRSSDIKLNYLGQVLDGLNLLGVSTASLAPSRCLNKFRNKIAHHGQDSIDNSFINEYTTLTKSVHRDFRDDITLVFSDQNLGLNKRYSEASNREKCVVATWYNLMLILAFAAAKTLAAQSGAK